MDFIWSALKNCTHKSSVTKSIIDFVFEVTPCQKYRKSPNGRKDEWYNTDSFTVTGNSFTVTVPGFISDPSLSRFSSLLQECTTRLWIVLISSRHSRHCIRPVSYTHLRAHETSLHLVCRLLLEKKKSQNPHFGWCKKRQNRRSSLPVRWINSVKKRDPY